LVGSDSEEDNPAPLLRPTKPRAAQNIRRQLRINVGAQRDDNKQAKVERAHVKAAAENQDRCANHADQDATEAGPTPAKAGKKNLRPETERVYEDAQNHR
jgi:hypothetical protein